MNNEPNKVDVKEEELLQVNGGIVVHFYSCSNPNCANYNIRMNNGRRCTVCGMPMKFGIAAFDSDAPDIRGDAADIRG